MLNNEQRGVVVTAGQGRQQRFGSNQQTVKIGPELGSQQLGIFESILPPGAGAFVHLHHQFEEAFYVLEGEMEYRLGESRVRARQGDWVFVPAGVVHGFKSIGPGNAHLIVITSPAAAMEMIEELTKVRPEEIGQVMAKHDSEFIEF